MPRGGKRLGAGRKPANRKPGAATTKTRAIANAIAADGGKMPLEVMIANMRHYQAEAEKAEKTLAEMRPKPGDQDAIELIKAAVKHAVGMRELANVTADRCSRFIHPILSPVDGKPRDAEFVPLADRLKGYATRDAIAGSGGKVVELKRKGKR
jgi:hypothetical protein